MTQNSVLFDAPGPRARLISTIISIAAIVGLLALGVWLFLILNAPRQSGEIELPGLFDASRWNIFFDFSRPEYAEGTWRSIGLGLWNTLRAAAVAAVGAILLGIAFSLMRSARSAWVRVPVTWLQEFLRGMPVLLMMLFILLIASTGEFWAVVVALVLYNGTIIGEALRAGLLALPRGQREAALSVGMRELQSKMLVEFPQAFRQMLPIIVAQLVVLLKDTSLGFIVGYPELIRGTMHNLSNYHGNRYLFSLFVVTLLIYLAINLTLSWFARSLAARTASGSGGPKKGRKPLPAQVLARQGTDTQLIAAQDKGFGGR